MIMKNQEIKLSLLQINQTNIPKATLRVTDPIHLQIEMVF